MATYQENSVPVARASVKRVADATSALASSAPLRKKRAVLGDLTNTVVGNSSVVPSAAHARSKKKVVKAPVFAVDEVDPCNHDPHMCGPYASDIYEYLQESEKKRRPSPNYMESVQHDVNANMRSILVDWLVEVADEYKLAPDTLHLAIAYIDRFLSSNALLRQKLQLLGISCMLLASKFEEVCPPHVEDFCYITDSTYTKEEVVEMERTILKRLNFEMTTPTIKTYLSSFIMAAECKNESPDLSLEYLCNFLAELSLLEYGCLQFLPSQMAASIVFLARFTLSPKTHPWSKHLQNQTGYKVSELKDCIQFMHDLQLRSKNCTLAAVGGKYKQHKFNAVSTLASPEKIPSTFFEDLN